MKMQPDGSHDQLGSEVVLAVFTQALRLASVLVPVAVVGVCLIFPRIVERPAYVAVYHAPAIGGFLLCVAYRLRSARRYGVLPGLLDAAVIVLCSLRMTAPLVPMSGHMLLFVYAVVTTPGRLFRCVMVGLIVETTYFKLVLWGDVSSWMWGVLSGVAMGWMYWQFLSAEGQSSPVN
ncbi:MAG: hypothetical protein QM754_19710 [Tepidisphaeraceae bacterium]